MTNKDLYQLARFTRPESPAEIPGELTILTVLNAVILLAVVLL